VFWFSLQLLSEIFLILGRIQEDIIINVHRSSCKVHVILVKFLSNLNFLCRFSRSKFLWKSTLCKPCCSMRMDRQTDRQTWRNYESL